MKPIFSGMLQNSQHLRSRILNNLFTFAYEKINVSVFVFFPAKAIVLSFTQVECTSLMATQTRYKTLGKLYKYVHIRPGDTCQLKCSFLFNGKYIKSRMLSLSGLWILDSSIAVVKSTTYILASEAIRNKRKNTAHNCTNFCLNF